MVFPSTAATQGASTKPRASSPPPTVLRAHPSPRGPAAPWSPLPAARFSSLPARPVDAGGRPGAVALAARTFAAGNALRGRWTVHLSTSCLVVKLPRVCNIDRFRPGLRRQELRASQDNKVYDDFLFVAKINRPRFLVRYNTGILQTATYLRITQQYLRVI